MKMRRLKRQLFKAQEGRCAICSEPMDQPYASTPESPLCATFEHVWPSGFRQGGEGHRIILLTHRGCNEKRGDDLPTPALLKVWADVQYRLALVRLEAAQDREANGKDRRARRRRKVRAEQ